MQYRKPDEAIKPKWRDILDSEKHPTFVGHISGFVPIAKSVGYTLICFNGLIWELENDEFNLTGWSASELEEGD